MNLLQALNEVAGAIVYGEKCPNHAQGIHLWEDKEDKKGTKYQQCINCPKVRLRTW